MTGTGREPDAAADHPTAAYTVTRVRRTDRALLGELAVAEPRTSEIVAALRARPRSGCRILLVSHPDRRVCAVLALRRRCFDTWTASVYLPDPGAAAVAARLVDRSPAMAVTGSVVDLAPVASHLRRAMRAVVTPRRVVPAPVGDILGAADARTRLATRADLKSLVALYEGFEYALAPTRWQLRGELRRVLRRDAIAVYVDAGEVVGAMMLLTLGAGYLTLTGLTVRPDRRRRGIAGELLKRAQVVAAERGVGVVAALAPSNPMDVDDIRVLRSDDPGEHLQSVLLRPRRRFRGQTRLRRLYRRVQPIRRRDAERYRDETTGDEAGDELTGDEIETPGARSDSGDAEA